MEKLLMICEAMFSIALYLLGKALLFGGIAILGFQCFIWLKSGTWMPISIVDATLMAGVSWQWLHAPDDYLGAHMMLRSIPASIAVATLAIIPVFFRAVLDESNPYK